ncbi:hypothetical protein HDU76_014078 [Blyttiomyces sp. JEL0837]|nr:hypothetical protein HDU76_014078 [Blyttiomyces sp. JEL0837]
MATGSESNMTSASESTEEIDQRTDEALFSNLNNVSADMKELIDELQGSMDPDDEAELRQLIPLLQTSPDTYAPYLYAIRDRVLDWAKLKCSNNRPITFTRLLYWGTIMSILALVLPVEGFNVTLAVCLIVIVIIGWRVQAETVNLEKLRGNINVETPNQTLLVGFVLEARSFHFFCGGRAEQVDCVDARALDAVGSVGRELKAEYHRSINEHERQRLIPLLQDASNTTLTYVNASDQGPQTCGAEQTRIFKQSTGDFFEGSLLGYHSFLIVSVIIGRRVKQEKDLLGGIFNVQETATSNVISWLLLGGQEFFTSSMEDVLNKVIVLAPRPWKLWVVFSQTVVVCAFVCYVFICRFAILRDVVITCVKSNAFAKAARAFLYDLVTSNILL